MGLFYSIVLDRVVEGLDTDMDGKGLAGNIEALDKAAAELRVRPLSEFISLDPSLATEFLEGEGVDTEGLVLPPLQHFTAQEGLAVIRTLLTHAVAQNEAVAHDLRDCERILASVAQNGAKWHFEVDF